MSSKTNVWSKVKSLFRFYEPNVKKVIVTQTKDLEMKYLWKEGDLVFSRDYVNPLKKNWIKEQIEKVLEKRSYIV